MLIFLWGDYSMKKLIKILFILAVILVAVVIGVNVHIKSTVEDNITENFDDFRADCILVLGCGVREDGTPSDMLYDRIKKGVELYQKGVAPKILMSGDHGRKSYDEVNVMKEYAMSMGVTEEDIFMDHAGFSTYESIYRAKEIFLAENIILVTQKYHLYRGLYISEKLGVNALGACADYHTYIGQNGRDLREIVARFKDFLNCFIKPKPKYLGEAIPVSGDGRVTEG